MTPYFGIRLLCFLAAVTSGVTLLLKVYGVAEMAVTVRYVVLPCSLALLVFWWWGRKGKFEDVAVAVGIGIVGGLLSTFAYDLVRLPFHLSGYLVFATNSTYGMWVSDAAASSRYTEVIGWLYHFSNGIAFSIMYAVFMRGRHWVYAIIYAFGLESIAIFSQFGQVFALAGNYSMISIAYLAHVAYALPIGIMVYKWDTAKWWISDRKREIAIFFVLFFAVFLIPIFNAENIARDDQVQAGVFEAHGLSLNPFMQKIQKGEAVSITNNNDADIVVQITKTGVTQTIGAGQSGQFTFANGGIHQFYILGEGRSKSSFVISEPVSDLPQNLAGNAN